LADAPDSKSGFPEGKWGFDSPLRHSVLLARCCDRTLVVDSLMDPVQLHLEAMIRAFLLPNKQERRVRKPRQFLDDLCHELPAMLEPRYVVPLSPLKTTPAIITFLSQLTAKKSAVYLGGWCECGESSLAAAVAEVDSTGGAAASIEPGMLVYYATEAHPRAERYLLARDENVRQRARTALETIESVAALAKKRARRS
jgi:hypothetical protein